jgi:hypothetical protein
MVKWLTSLFMLAVLCGSTVAGTPLHSAEHECSMPGMKDGMDCCAKAHARQDSAEARAARLCCAVNCQSPGAATPTASLLRVSPPAAAPRHPAAPRTAFVIPASNLLFDSAREHPQHSPPPYIQHLALLI